MNVLDENITPIERQRLREWHIAIRHIGYDIGRKGMDDEAIIPFLVTLSHPTFFTEDWDYYKRRLCHAKYCLVHVNVRRDEIAVFARRFLRHHAFDTNAKRMGRVIRITRTDISVWQRHAGTEVHLSWSK